MELYIFLIIVGVVGWIVALIDYNKRHRAKQLH